MEQKSLFAIVKIIHQADDSHLYEIFPVRPLEKKTYKLSDIWLEIKNILDGLHSEKNLKAQLQIPAISVHLLSKIQV
ncbi:hypothetical protein [Microcoleus sp. Pol12B4]|uniref:hypothetical protein n=1 Tax=Microcoleus sp. Pol12B4 TaxID=3055395 RepID=UPI002FD25882